MALHLPAEFEKYMKERLGAEFNEFHRSLEEPAPVSIRINPGKVSEIKTSGDSQGLMKLLVKNINNGYDNTSNGVPWCRNGRYLPERPVFTLDPALHAGAYYVQEASSMFLEQAIQQSVDLKKSLNVLDLCAAPGGKSTHILSLISRDSLLISNEVIRSRASVLLENTQKWGNDNVIVTSSDPAVFERLPDFFDLIVLDAPCSEKDYSGRTTPPCRSGRQRMSSYAHNDNEGS